MTSRIVFALALLGAAGCNGPLVGGTCLDGYREADGACVASPEPQGAGGGGQAPAGTGGGQGAGSSEGGAGQGGDAVVVGQGGDGAGGVIGAGGAGGDAPGGGGPGCDFGETACGDQCVDTFSDPYDCGGCGVVCASGLCVDGRCEGSYAGHVVVAGFGEDALASIAPGRLIGNAIFAWPVDPVRVGVLRTAPHSGALADAVAREAASRSRTAQIEDFADANALAARLDAGTLDVAIIGAMAPSVPDAATTGATLHAGFAALTARGGVVTVLADGTPPVVEAIVVSSGLSDDFDDADSCTGNLEIAAFDDALTVGVPSPFAQPADAVTFSSDSFPGRVVIRDQHNKAVVLHGVVIP